MKILYILHSMTLGGAEKHALTLMDEMHKLGHTPIYAGQKGSWLSKEVERKGYTFYHVSMHGFYDLSSILKLFFIAKKENVDLIHGHLTRGAFYAGISSKLTNIHSIATAHSTNAGKHFGGVNHIIAVSDAVKKFLIQSGYDPRSITRIHNGIEDFYDKYKKFRSKKRDALKLKESEIALCVVGRFLKDKGQDIAIKALSISKDANTKLFLAGDTGTKWADEMKKTAELLNLEKKVFFLGQQDNIAKLLCAMDIAIVPSRREAISLAMLEACSMQKAIIASKVGGIGEVISNEENGLLFPSEDIATLAKSIDRLAKDETQREVLGKKARETFLRGFTALHMAKETETLYKEVARI